jgi:Zn-dependent M16 (insulinase) family peptidase
METQFTLIRETPVAELNGIVKEYRHQPTGAEYISVENEDNNKVFGITFRTPPTDSTGIAHILEHTVLCGSRKYPLKDPFVQLLKGSMQTFLNAMTYPDKTVYPVASQNVQDFYNLVDVYLDAVFFPRITPAFFRQEGWHYELENPDAPLTCKGVVYNEMKGAYSSPDSLLLERSQQSLFPDTTYSLDSGGDPAVIPTLTYGDFREFHETWYHPSNARIFFYGNDDPAKRLEILEEYLGGFQTLKNPPDSSIPLQPAFKEPIQIQETYAAGDEDSKAFITVNWALPEGSLHFALIVLEHILTGTSGSPLRKALIESGLGEDIAGFGLETHMRQPAYSIGMKGADLSDLGKIEALIFQTLEELVRDGIDPGDIDAALNSFEFDLRENNQGSCPQGLSVMLTMLETWLYDWDPLVLAAYEKPLAGLKQARADNPRYFEELIENTLLKNTHRSTVRFIPDARKAEQEDAEDAARLQAVKDSMIPDEIKRTITAAERLLDMQKAPDSPSAIQSLPLLCRNDLRKEIRTIPREIDTVGNATILFHDLFTGGIAYIDVGFDLHVLEAGDLPWVSLLGSMLFEMGTQKEDFASLSQRIARKTGGIYASPVHAVPEDSGESVSRLFLRGKCMADRIEDLTAILSDILFFPAFDNTKRFKEVLLEQKAEMESGLVPSGHTAVLSRLKAHYHESSQAAEVMGGIDALFFHRDIETRAEDDWPAIRARIEGILQKLLRGGLVINVTADGKDRAAIFQTLEKFLAAFPNDGTRGTEAQIKWVFEGELPCSEALLVPSRVNYVGSAINLFDNGYRYDGSALVVTKYLRTAWLWEKIRVQGGAYGAVCTFEPNCGSFAFASYRDPNLADTLDAYNRTGEFLKNLTIDEDELSRALIGAIGGIDTYRLPDAKGYCDTLRWLTGATDEIRQRRRNQILATTADHFRQFGEFFTMDHAVISVLGSKEAIENTGLSFARSLKVL